MKVTSNFFLGRFWDNFLNFFLFLQQWSDVSSLFSLKEIEKEVVHLEIFNLAQ